jgi:Pyruvate/2-oxoacid:ferredoxin oxidoreductase delta subunit
MTGINLAVVISAVIIIGVLFWLVGERGKFPMPSTWKWIQAGGLLRFLNLSTLHGYIYMRWQKAYIRLFVNQINPHSTQPARKWWANQYHSKVLTEPQARTLITINEPIPQQDLEQVIPYPVARNILLSAPPAITVYECGCRLARKDHCTPTQVCMFIGEPFASFMLEHHPKESKALTQKEALELLKAEHERGHVHTAWFKNAMLDRFYVICNCCKCCCGGIEQMVKYDIPMMTSSGYVASVDEALCAACGTCTDTCPFGALSLEDHSVVDWQKCMGCGVCVDQCPNEAMALLRDEQKGLPLDARALSGRSAI